MILYVCDMINTILEVVKSIPNEIVLAYGRKYFGIMAIDFFPMNAKVIIVLDAHLFYTVRYSDSLVI